MNKTINAEFTPEEFAGLRSFIKRQTLGSFDTTKEFDAVHKL